jgi:cell division ATPase FtsA
VSEETRLRVVVTGARAELARSERLQKRLAASQVRLHEQGEVAGRWLDEAVAELG